MGARRVSFVRSGAAVLAAVAIMAGCAAQPASTVVTSSCQGGPDPHTETVTSVVHHSGPRAGQTITLEVQVRRLQVDVGPVLLANYTFPVPDGIAAVESVTFADPEGNPHIWATTGDNVVIGFRAPEGSHLTNDFPPVFITYRIPHDLPVGRVITFEPFVHYTQEFRDWFMGCTRISPDVLQSIAIVA